MKGTKFIIGIGSQRAGSTLLHRILDECTDIFMHPVKELHYYDTLFKVRSQAGLTKFSHRQLNKEINRLLLATKFDYIDDKYRCFLRTTRLLSETSINQIEYTNLFDPWLRKHVRVGEVTPEYMILPPQGIQKMAADIGTDAKIILVARDPVARFVASVKLLKAYNGVNVSAKQFEAELLKVVHGRATFMKRQDDFNDYEASLENYKKVFPNVLVLEHSWMFRNIERTSQILKEFLSIPIDTAAWKNIANSKVNSLGKTGNISEDTQKLLSDRWKRESEFVQTLANDGPSF